MSNCNCICHFQCCCDVNKCKDVVGVKSIYFIEKGANNNNRHQIQEGDKIVAVKHLQ